MSSSQSTPRTRLDMKKVFLTWPNLPLETFPVPRDAAHGMAILEDVCIPAIDTLIGTDARFQECSAELDSLSICYEKHSESGRMHIHAMLIFKKPLRLRDMSVFDLFGQHPNITAVRNVKDSLIYLAKDGIYINRGIGRFTIAYRALPLCILLEELSMTDECPSLAPHCVNVHCLDQGIDESDYSDDDMTDNETTFSDDGDYDSDHDMLGYHTLYGH